MIRRNLCNSNDSKSASYRKELLKILEWRRKNILSRSYFFTNSLRSEETFVNQAIQSKHRTEENYFRSLKNLHKTNLVIRTIWNFEKMLSLNRYNRVCYIYLMKFKSFLPRFCSLFKLLKPARPNLITMSGDFQLRGDLFEPLSPSPL